MKQSDIHIGRGIGWSTPAWQEWEPLYRRAAIKAERGLGQLGIHYAEPKLGTVRRFARRGEMAEEGLAFDAIHFRLHVVTPEPSEKPQVARRLAASSGVIVHEVLHCARSERVQGHRLVENIATEGLAYLGEYRYAQKFYPRLSAGFVRLFDCDLKADSRLSASFRDVFERSNKETRAGYQWFNARTRIPDMPDGALFGVQCVQRHLNEGRRFADLLHLPAEELLGL